MNESSRFKESDAEVIINNEEVLTARIADTLRTVEKQKSEIAELKGQVKILKEVIAESRGY